MDGVVPVRDVQVARGVTRSAKRRQLVLLGRRLLDRQRRVPIAAPVDLLLGWSGLGFGLGELFLPRRDVDVVGSDLGTELLLFGRREPLLARPLPLVHSASDPSKRRSWWWSLCESLSRFVAR